MLTIGLSLLASTFAFAAGFLIGAWWRSGRERIIVVPASPPMRPPPPQIDMETRSPYAPRLMPATKPPPPTERVVRWYPDTKATNTDSPPTSLLPSIPWGTK